MTLHDRWQQGLEKSISTTKSTTQCHFTINQTEIIYIYGWGGGVGQGVSQIKARLSHISHLIFLYFFLIIKYTYTLKTGNLNHTPVLSGRLTWIKGIQGR